MNFQKCFYCEINNLTGKNTKFIDLRNGEWGFPIQRILTNTIKEGSSSLTSSSNEWIQSQHQQTEDTIKLHRIIKKMGYTNKQGGVYREAGELCS